MTVTIPGMRILSSANRREHHMALYRRMKRLKRETHMMLLTQQKPEHDAYVVTMTRIAPRMHDSDNLANAMKGPRDSVAAYLGIDDGNTDRLLFKYQQEPGPWAARIEIEEWRKDSCHECGQTLGAT